MKHSSEYDAFTRLVDQVLAVPRDEIKRRAEKYRKAPERNPNRRGPKRKATKPSASRDSS